MQVRTMPLLARAAVVARPSPRTVSMNVAVRGIALSFAGVCPKPLVGPTGRQPTHFRGEHPGEGGGGAGNLHQEGTSRCGIVHKTTVAGGRSADPAPRGCKFDRYLAPNLQR